MNRYISNLSLGLVLALMVAGCGKSGGGAGSSTTGDKASSGGTAAPVAEAVSKSATAVKDIASKEGTDLAQKLLATASQTKPDQLLQSIGKDVQTSVANLRQSLTSDATLQGSLDTVVQALVGNQDIKALDAYQKLTGAKLTPEQTELAKEVKDTISAFVVQKNFSGLADSESDVAKIVSALRQGDAVAAVPAIQKVATSAQLTGSQKELLTSLADQYAPGLKSAGKAVQEGVKPLNLFKK